MVVVTLALAAHYHHLCAYLSGDANRLSQQQSVVFVLRSARPQAPRVRQPLAGGARVEPQMPHARIGVHSCQLTQAPEVRREQREAACGSSVDVWGHCQRQGQRAQDSLR